MHLPHRAELARRCRLANWRVGDALGFHGVARGHRAPKSRPGPAAAKLLTLSGWAGRSPLRSFRKQPGQRARPAVFRVAANAIQTSASCSGVSGRSGASRAASLEPAPGCAPLQPMPGRGARPDTSGLRDGRVLPPVAAADALSQRLQRWLRRPLAPSLLPGPACTAPAPRRTSMRAPCRPTSTARSSSWTTAGR